VRKLLLADRRVEIVADRGPETIGTNCLTRLSWCDVPGVLNSGAQAGHDE
jgi:hypothetical protein